MSFQLVIKEGARSDITAAFQYYSSISSALGDDFLERLEQAFERITFVVPTESLPLFVAE